MTTASTDPLIGRLIDGRYQVRSRIARGGMATVYLATDLRLERRVAIKVMHSHLTEDAAFRDRFIQEARSAARLAHPNVVNVFDQGQDSDMAYLVMEYLPGITLRELLEQHKRLTAEQTMDIMEAVLAGLAAAHKAGIVHRDLKPENVLLADDGRIKIGDFGLARAASAATATGQALLGTIAYLSPELLTRGVADTRSDIYAVGIMMYEMLTGEQPYKGEQPMQIAYQHANDTVPAPSIKVPSVPPELDDLVLWATARDPEQRPRDARMMLDQLFEAQNSIHAGLGATSVMKQTVVLPAAVAMANPTGATQVIGARHRTGPIMAASTTQLELKSDKRRRKGWWFFTLVLIIAAVAGGTGWYFGSGPGAGTAIPSYAGGSPADATTDLKQLGFEVTEKHRYDLVNAKDTVSGTSPESGTFVRYGSNVTLYISDGAKPLPMPPLVGLTLDQATTILETDFTLGEVIKQFDAAVPADQVMAAQAPDGTPLPEGATYYQAAPVDLVVSAGPLPAVAGESLSAAQAILTGVDLTGVAGESVYSDTVPIDTVIDIQPQTAGAPIRAGETVNLTISKGPEPVIVPDVVGNTFKTARQKLTDLGFVLSYNNASVVDLAPSGFVVKSMNPPAGTTQPKGSTITLNVQLP